MGDAVEVSTTIAAPAEQVYAAVSDITRMGEWSPECSRGKWLGGATEAKPGARFRGSNKNGPFRWSTTCTIVTADPGREVSWEVRYLGLRVALWRYRFSADGHGGTAVVESTEDRRGFLIKTFSPVATGVGDRAARNRETMEVTLERVKQAVEGVAA
jgi:uncharacterized protein YndB with AHSA1/START domain